MNKYLYIKNLTEGGFAGLMEHQLIKSPLLFGPECNQDGSWSGIGNCVYLADAHFLPHGETRLHEHQQIDVISIMVDGKIHHQGSLKNGQSLSAFDVQIQRSGSIGFTHNEINPDDHPNRMIQLWILPEQDKQRACYQVFHLNTGELTLVYGGNSLNHKQVNEQGTLTSNTMVQVGRLEKGRKISIIKETLVYIMRGQICIDDQIFINGQLVMCQNNQLLIHESAYFILLTTVT